MLHLMNLINDRLFWLFFSFYTSIFPLHIEYHYDLAANNCSRLFLLKRNRSDDL